MLKCETLWRNKYSQPTFSISQEMANITQSQFKLPSSSQMSLASSGMLSSDATLSCTDFSSDALEPSYASSQPPSFNASSFLNTSLFSSSRLPKPSSIPDAKLSPTLFRHYVAAYFQRHATAACSAHSLMKMNEALKRLGRRTVKHCGMSTGQAGRISAFGRISKSGSQESVGASQEDSTLRLFSQTLNALARDGVIVPATEADRGALQPSKASASPSASGWKKHAFYVCLTADLLRRVLSRCLGQLHARAMKGRESGVSESTLVDEVRESEDGRWYWVSDKEMKRVLDELDQDEEQPVMKVVSRNGQVRWLWCA